MTDRERLDELTKAAIAKRVTDANEAATREAEKQQRERDKLAAEQKKTDELKAFCEATFNGFKLPPTGHDLTTRTTATNLLSNIVDEDPKFVTVTISHWGDGVPGGDFPILSCRYSGGRYELAIGSGRVRAYSDNLEDFKETLLKTVAGFGSDEVGKLLEAVRQLPRRG